MAEPRTTSNDADELAATISSLKSRLNDLESVSGLGRIPVGSIVDFMGSTAPSGWTLLDGTTITNGRRLYPNLWNILPDIYKAGDDIKKPDTRGRVTVHQGGTNLNLAIGSIGGAETVALTEAQMPSHTHLAQMVKTNFEASGYTVTSGSNGFTNRVYINTTTYYGNNYIDYTGSGQAHNNLQPFIIVVKIMKLG